MMRRPSVDMLMVEDDPGDAELMLEVLGELEPSPSVTVATDGTDGLAVARRTFPKVIVLDLNLPGRSGFEVLAALKQDQDLRAIPVIILTTSTRQEDIRRSYELGASCVLSKPMGLAAYTRLLKALHTFWFVCVQYPSGTPGFPSSQ